MPSQPMSARFGCILCTPNAQVQDALDTAIAAVSVMELLGERNSASAQRSIYQTTDARLIVNVPAPHMLQALGQHFAVLALTVNGSPPEAAELFADTLKANGVTAKVQHGLEPEMPVMSFVTVEAMPGIAFMMWPEQGPANAPEVTAKD